MEHVASLTIEESPQLELGNAPSAAIAYGPIFKRIYYHLYSNSAASRAETIVSDLANLLLCKAADERSNSTAVDDFLAGKTEPASLIASAREAYPLLISDDDRFRLDSDVLRLALRELAEVSFSSAPGHVLGDAFEALIGPRLRGDRGQFFTPRSLVRAIVAMVDPTAGSKIIDPACGTGGFLAEAQAHIHRQGNATFIGIDKDADLAKLAESMLEMTCAGQATVINRNSLDLRALSELPQETSPLEADFVLTNPPFGTKIKVTDPEILRQYALGHKWIKTKSGWAQSSALLDGQDPQILFIELCIRLLKCGGRLGIVLPEGIFGNKGQEYVWHYIAQHGRIEALLDCPRTTFQPSTDVKTNVLVFEKGAAQPIRDAWIAVALHCGHDRRGRSHRADGSPYPDDFRELGLAYKRKERPWERQPLSNPSYLVPRYYQAPESVGYTGKTITLGELVRRGEIALRKGDEVGSEAYGTGDVPFVRTSDISNYEVSIDPTKGVSEEIYERYSRSQALRSGDILMIADGRYRIGRTAILTEETVKCVVQSHLKIISVLPNCRFSSFELLYLLSLPHVQAQIRNLVFIQSTLGSIGGRVKEIRLPVPDGSPEWETRVSSFRNILETRAKLLHELTQFEHGDLEL